MQWPDSDWLEWLPVSEVISRQPGGSAALKKAVHATAQSGSRVSYSDAVRFLVLYRYGGIYFDADVLMLRGLEPFGSMDFIYEWSFLHNRPNTAVTGLQKGSHLALDVIERALNRSIGTKDGRLNFDVQAFTQHFHPHNVFKGVAADLLQSLRTLPCAVFDPLWVTADSLLVGKYPSNNITQLHNLRTFKEAFQHPAPYLQLPQDITDIFQGAFAYHWHNNWHAPLVGTSVMGQLATAYTAFLQGQRPNAAGLMFKPCTST